MCGLFASRNPYKLEEFFKLNTRRGQTRMSISSFSIDDEYERVDLQNYFESEKIALDAAATVEGHFHLGHIQAPTSVLNKAHPAKYNGLSLWHNGIIKEETIKSLQELSPDPIEGWDTYLMARGLRNVECQNDVSKFLSSLEGSFACFMYALGQLYVFRNEISPLFVDKDLNFSSVKFKGSNSIDPGIVFGLDFKYNRLDDTGIHFTTANNPYIL